MLLELYTAGMVHDQVLPIADSTSHPSSLGKGQSIPTAGLGP